MSTCNICGLAFDLCRCDDPLPPPPDPPQPDPCDWTKKPTTKRASRAMGGSVKCRRCGRRREITVCGDQRCPCSGGVRMTDTVDIGEMMRKKGVVYAPLDTPRE